MRILLLLLLMILSCFLFPSCFKFKDRNVNYPDYRDSVYAEAYVPVFGYDSVKRTIVSAAPRTTVKAGKIYVFGNYLFQVENDSGIHVINYADINNPVKLGFIRSFGCNEIAVKNNYLITNNLDDLVTLDISNISSVKEVSRIRKAFKTFYFYYNARPPVAGKHYICPQSWQGDLIGWTLEKNVKGAYCN